MPVSNSTLSRTSLEDTARKICESRGGKWSGTKGMACCPAHDDRTPSLSVSLGRQAIRPAPWWPFACLMTVKTKMRTGSTSASWTKSSISQRRPFLRSSASMDGAAARTASSCETPSPIAAYRPGAGSPRSGSSSATMLGTGKPISARRERRGHGTGSPRCRIGSSTCSGICAWSGGSRMAKRSSSAPDPTATPGPDPASSLSAGRGPWAGRGAPQPAARRPVLPAPA